MLWEQEITEEVLLNKKDVKLKMSKGQWFYTGSGYCKQYGLTDRTAPTTTYSHLPIEIPAIGFNCKGSKIKEFYCWDVESGQFKTFPSWSGIELTPEIYQEFLLYTGLKEEI